MLRGHPRSPKWQPPPHPHLTLITRTLLPPTARLVISASGPLLPCLLHIVVAGVRLAFVRIGGARWAMRIARGVFISSRPS
jgi:hypothetical protein